MKKRLAVIVVTLSLLVPNIIALPVATDTALTKLKEEGIMKNVSVDFNKVVTRGEAVHLLAKILGKREMIKEKVVKHPFTDIPREASGEIGALYEAQIIKGVSDKTFGYNQTITLKEFLIMYLRAFSYPEIDVYMRNLEYECERVFGTDEFPVSLTEVNRPLTNGNMISISHLGLFVEQPKGYEAYVHKQGALDVCEAGEWVYYAILGDEEGFHKYSPITNEDIYLRPFDEISVDGSTAITSQLADGCIVYRIQDLTQTDELGNLYTMPARFYRLNLKDDRITKQVIGKVKNVTEDSLEFDLVEWLAISREDDIRIRSLKLNRRNDFPNGFYIYNEAVEFSPYSLTESTTYQIIGEDGISFEYITKEAFKASVGDEKVYTLLLEDENRVKAVIQAYIP